MSEQRVDVTVVRWYERRDRVGDLAGRWLAAAREHLPEALPLRFGDSEPLRGRFRTAGEVGLTAAWQRAQQLLFLQCTPPILHASWSAPHVPAYWGRCSAHSLQTLLPVTDVRLKHFALAFAGGRAAYVSASVARGMILDRTQLVGPAESPEEVYLAPLGRWHGPPRQPPAWCWFGPDYARRLRRHIDAEAVGNGLSYTGGRWVPERFTARFDEIEPGARRARRLPRSLR